MKNWLYKFMAGRYGMDQMGRFMMWFTLGVIVINMFFSGTVAGTVIWFVTLGLIVWNYFRMFSKNVSKRYQENMKFLSIKNKVTGFFKSRVDRIKQSKDYRFYKCPKCGVTNRVPRNKGTIRITCPKCRESFVRKT